MTDVRGRRVLIVEDEFLLAQELSRYFASMGAVVLGPAPDVRSAEKQVDYADVAVLDIDLNGDKVFPIADELERRGVPFVFFTGRGDIAIPARFRHAAHLSKPFDGSAVFEALFPSADGDAADAPVDDVFAILPKLRLAALLLLEDAAPADRLVELTLESALSTLQTREEHSSLESWLTSLLEEAYRRHGRRLLL